MAIKKWSEELFPSFPSMFGSGIFDMSNFTSPGMTLPAVNVKETRDNFIVELAAPGMKKDDFKIELHENTLTISSSKESEKEEKGKDGEYTRREFSYQSFQRSFTLPHTIKEESISAKYTDGVLEVTIPKKEESKPKEPRKIDVN